MKWKEGVHVLVATPYMQLGYMRCMVKCIPIKVLPLDPFHHWPTYPMITHTPLVPSN